MTSPRLHLWRAEGKALHLRKPSRAGTLPLVRVPWGMWLRGKESCLCSVPKLVDSSRGRKEGRMCGEMEGDGEAIERKLPNFPIQGLDGAGSRLPPSRQGLGGWTGPREV